MIPQLTEAQRLRLRKTAEQKGFEIFFFQTAAAAQPFLPDAEILFSGDASLAENAPLAQWICSPTAGVNQFFASGQLLPQGAVLTNSSGAYGVTISEHIIMLLLEILRRQQEYNAVTAHREWRRDLPVRSIFGSRISLLGTGNIGQETARRLRAFSPARLNGISRSGGNPCGLFDETAAVSQLPRLARETDIMILSLPGTQETFHLVSAEILRLLPDDAILVNVGRGSVIDQTALEKELRNERLYAALDVFEQEPLPPDHSLWSCPRLLISPHAAGNMTLRYTADRIVEMFIENLDRYTAGQPLSRIVQPSKGY